MISQIETTIAKLDVAGHRTLVASDLLVAMRACQGNYERDRERYLRLLKNMDAPRR